MFGKKHSLFSILSLFTILICGCSAAKPIYRDTLPEHRPEADILGQKTSLIRTADCDVSLCLISESQWDSLQRVSSFKKGAFGEPSKMIPFDLFFVTITNTSEQPLTGVTASCTFGETAIEPLSPDQVSAKTSSAAFKNAVLEKIFAHRRLITLDYEFDKIDFDKDTIAYPFRFILPLDRVCYIIAFQPIPADIRHYTVSILYSTPSVKKKVDFRFTKNEHRDEE